MKFNHSIFIFRREYRVEDNTGLIEAAKQSKVITPIFIFTPEQIGDENKFKSNNAVQFMIESLIELSKIIPLQFFHGKQDVVIEDLIKENKENKENKIDAVFVNRDYSKYAKDRDAAVAAVCKKHKVAFHSFEDYLLYPVGSIKTQAGTTFHKFTPYYNAAIKYTPRSPNMAKMGNFNALVLKSKFTIDEKMFRKFYVENPNITVHGGRKLGLKILDGIKSEKNFKDYNKTRNTLNTPTTRLSAYIKFGCVSIREVYHVILSAHGKNSDLIKQLLWREFYYNILDENPHLVDPKSNRWTNFKEVYDKVPWLTKTEAPELWKAFVECRTGFPLVDAGNRELQQTGFMHNRARLVVASFLVKNMFIHWREGEQYFSQYLIDIDPAVNNGNWQFVSGSGVDTQPYFRIFSPTLQMRYDPGCLYVLQWLPELSEVPCKHIKDWPTHYSKYPTTKYPKPVLDYTKTSKKAIKKYETIF